MRSLRFLRDFYGIAVFQFLQCAEWSRDDLIARIKRGDVSALAELTTIHILRSDRPLAALELGPDVTIGSSPRKPDFRVRGRSSDPWTYVEVTQTDTSDAEERLRALMARLVTPINEAKKERP